MFTYIPSRGNTNITKSWKYEFFIRPSIFRLIVFMHEVFVSVNLSVDVSIPEEGDNITITGKVLKKNFLQNGARWYKDGELVKIDDRLISKKEKRKFSLVIMNCNVYDSGNYSIEVHGKKRSFNLEIKGNKFSSIIKKK